MKKSEIHKLHQHVVGQSYSPCGKNRRNPISACRRKNKQRSQSRKKRYTNNCGGPLELCRQKVSKRRDEHTSSTTWDGYAATCVVDAGLESLESGGREVAVSMIAKPSFYA